MKINSFIFYFIFELQISQIYRATRLAQIKIQIADTDSDFWPKYSCLSAN